MANSGGTWSAQVSSELDKKLSAYHEKHGVSRSETVRYLLRKGIEYERGEISKGGVSRDELGVASALLLAVTALAWLTAGPVGLVVLLAAIVGYGIGYGLAPHVTRQGE